MERGNTPAGADHQRRGGKDDVGPVAHGLFHGLQVISAVGVIDVGVHPVCHVLFQVFPPVLMGPGPGASRRVKAVDERGVQPAGVDAEELGDQLPGLPLGTDADGDGLPFGHELNIGPYGAQVLLQLLRALIFDIAEGKHLEPDKQRVRRRNLQLFRVQLVKGGFEMEITGQKAAPLLVGPDVLRLKAQSRLQPGKAAGPGEVQLIQPDEPVKVHEFIVELHGGILGIGGDDPCDHTGDSGRAVAFQHADPFVALLHIEAAHIFTALDGVTDALVAQMRVAKGDPFGGKFRVGTQQRHEISGQGGAPAHAFYADDLLRGDIHQPHLHPARDHGFVQNLVQRLEIGVSAADHRGFIVLLPQLQSVIILFKSFLSAHNGLLRHEIQCIL